MFNFSGEYEAVNIAISDVTPERSLSQVLTMSL